MGELKEFPKSATQKQNDKWYEIESVTPEPVQSLTAQTTFAIQEMVEAGDNYAELVDKVIEDLRTRVMDMWGTYRDKVREVENPTVAKIQELIAAHQAKLAEITASEGEK